MELIKKEIFLLNGFPFDFFPFRIMLYFSRYQAWAVKILKNNYGDTINWVLSGLIIIEFSPAHVVNTQNESDTEKSYQKDVDCGWTKQKKNRMVINNEKYFVNFVNF